MTIKEIRQLTNLSQKKFCEKYGIPLQTLCKWEQGYRTCPDYVAELLEFKVREDLKMDKEISYSILKDMLYTLKTVSEKESEKMIDNFSEKEKDFLLRLYVYESRKTVTD